MAINYKIVVKVKIIKACQALVAYIVYFCKQSFYSIGLVNRRTSFFCVYYANMIPTINTRKK